MICLLAGNYLEAQRWAIGQLLDDDEWFYPIDFDDLRKKSSFHVLVIGSAGQNVPVTYFERLLNLAKERGKINRS